MKYGLKNAYKIKTLILMVLQAGPMYGYGMIEIIKKASGGTLIPLINSIYPAINDLEADGLIELIQRDEIYLKGSDINRKYYQLTDEAWRIMEECAAFEEALAKGVELLDEDREYSHAIKQ